MAVDQSTLAPPGYYAFASPAGDVDTAAVKRYVLGLDKVKAALGGVAGEGEMEVASVGDGNLNLVFLVAGKGGAKVVVKQALPYVKCVGEGWPLTLKRCEYEANALQLERECAPEFVPEVYHTDYPQGIIVMRYVEPPHRILRGALMEQLRFPSLANDMGLFLARSLYLTSSAHLPADEVQRKAEAWGYTELGQLSEAVIFTDPFLPEGEKPAFPNRCTPGLEDLAKEVGRDEELRGRVGVLKELFKTKKEALIHGDLHTGSVMACEGSTFVIDPEFGMYGPMAFDIGAFQANILLSLFSHWGHAKAEGGDRSDQMQWVAGVLKGCWAAFETEFTALWQKDKGATGDEAKDFIRRVLEESFGFAGCKMIRRIVGVAHVEDLESIKDEGARGEAERKAVALARRLVTSPKSFDGWAAVADAALASC
eukprot:Hpha_TRINITY_DN2547_c0_g1::TRINITY_DN2547_c0_g1_i1::g.1396::m.1396/K00899/mtnK; 5-methylthioribose kinase